MTPRVPSWACLIYMLQLERECPIVVLGSRLLLYKDLCTLISIYDSRVFLSHRQQLYPLMSINTVRCDHFCII